MFSLTASQVDEVRSKYLKLQFTGKGTTRLRGHCLSEVVEIAGDNWQPRRMRSKHGQLLFPHTRLVPPILAGCLRKRFMMRGGHAIVGSI